MRGPVAPTAISFAQVGLPTDDLGHLPFFGYASTDRTSAEAQTFADSVTGRTGSDAVTALARMFAAPTRAFADQVAQALHGHIIVSVADKRCVFASAVVDLLFAPMFYKTSDCVDIKWIRTKFAEGLREGLEALPGDLQTASDACDAVLTLDPDAFRIVLYGDRSKVTDTLDLIARNRSAIVANINRNRPPGGWTRLQHLQENLNALQDHTAAWGRHHRLVTVTCDEAAWESIQGATYQSDHLAGGMVRNVPGFWEAWRLSGPTTHQPASKNLALLVASMFASDIALYVTNGGSTAECADLGKYLEGHLLGDVKVFPDRAAERHEELLDLLYIQGQRDTEWACNCENDRNPHFLLDLSSWILGGEQLNCRDCLLFKLLGRMPIATVLGLDIEAIDVDRSDNLYTMPEGPETRQLLYKMDSTDSLDLWSIIKLAATLDGPLFTTFDRGLRRRLTETEVQALIHQRTEEFRPTKRVRA